MKQEIFFLIGRDGQVLYQDGDRNPLALTDKRSRWEAIWSHRAELTELSHSHPVGPEAFSDEDVSTMRALDDALGRRLAFSLVTPRGTFARDERDRAMPTEPAPWVQDLRRDSGLPSVHDFRDALPFHTADELGPLVDALRTCAHVIFVCTHNSRRSQLAEAVARGLAHALGLTHLRFSSAGTVATQVASPALDTLRRAGLPTRELFSKTLGDAALPKRDFIAVMVCTDADEACPLVPGATARVRLPFIDPKRSDGTPDEAATYDACLQQLGRDLGATFSALLKK